MDAPDRGALMLVRFIALALISVTVVDLALYWVVTHHNQTEMTIFQCVLKSIPAVIGLVILIKAKALAEWISSLLDQ